MRYYCVHYHLSYIEDRLSVPYVCIYDIISIDIEILRYLLLVPVFVRASTGIGQRYSA